MIDKIYVLRRRIGAGDTDKWLVVCGYSILWTSRKADATAMELKQLEHVRNLFLCDGNTPPAHLIGDVIAGVLLRKPDAGGE